MKNCNTKLVINHYNFHLVPYGNIQWTVNVSIAMGVYNTNGFKTETMYDYYIVMKSMFLVVKLSSHSSIVFVSITILLLWTIHNQHQNYSKPKAYKNPKLPFP